MATFDQLPAEQRAILELVVGRGQSYEELSELLGMPPARVRELAREALGDLAPATAQRVDSDWRGQIADYVLGQQTGPESTATRGHFKRSEPARAWAYSLLDSLAHLYPDGTMPDIPDADGSEPKASAPPAPPASVEAAPVAPPAPEPAAPAPAPAAPPPPPRERKAALSPAARAIVRRRRIIGGVVLLAALVVGILAIAGVFSGGGGKSKHASSAQSRATAYEVWLYNSSSDTLPLGAQFTDAQGNLQGRGVLPSNWRHFRSVVLSREHVGTNPKAPATVVLQGTLASVPTKSQPSRNGIRIVSEGVLKPSQGETGAGLALVLVQGGQQQLVIQAARLTPTTNVLPPATGTTGATGATGTTGP